MGLIAAVAAAGSVTETKMTTLLIGCDRNVRSEKNRELRGGNTNHHGFDTAICALTTSAEGLRILAVYHISLATTQ